MEESVEITNKNKIAEQEKNGLSPQNSKKGRLALQKGKKT